MANNPYTSPNQSVPNAQLAQRQKPKARGPAMMARGAILAAVGIVISLLSYSCASASASSGGTGYYTIFYGFIVIGVIYFIVGLFRSLAGR